MCSFSLVVTSSILRWQDLTSVEWCSSIWGQEESLFSLSRSTSKPVPSSQISAPWKIFDDSNFGTFIVPPCWYRPRCTGLRKGRVRLLPPAPALISSNNPPSLSDWYLGDLFKVMVNGLPSNRDHIVKQRQLLKSFRPQNLEHDVHDDESLHKRVILIMDSCCRCSWSKDVVGELNVRCYLVLDQGKHRKTLGNHQNAENHKITFKSQDFVT